MATKYRMSDNYVGRAKSANFQENQQRAMINRARERMTVTFEEKSEKRSATRNILTIILAFAAIYSAFLLIT